MRKKTKTIGVDLDSTLIKMTVFGKAAKELGLGYTDKDALDWNQSNMPDDMKRRIMEMFNDSVIMCDQAEPIEGTQEKIKEWTELGHHIVLITARGPKLHQPTIEMVNRLYPELEDINFVNFSESKIDKLIEKEIQIWVDDAPHGVIDAMSLHIPTIMISNKYTKYNWKVRHHPRLHAIVKTLTDITSDMIHAPWITGPRKNNS